MRTHIHLYPLVLAILVMVACDSKTKTVEACGDGFVDPGEDCDTTTGENTCASLGYYNLIGELRCNPDCTLDDSSCGGRCGDGDVQADDGEECDGTNLNGNSCQSLGYHGGTLSCDSDCRFVLADCDALGQCGDELIQETFEQCDGSNLNDQTCETLGNHPGSLSCTETCEFDLTACGGTCGDEVIQDEFDEQCDGADLGSQSCVSLGFSARDGVLSCTAECAFDTSACVERGGLADLATLSVDVGSLNPPFSAEYSAYSVTLPFADETVTVSATAADAPYATVSITPSQPASLAVGSNIIGVRVIAENGVTKDYQVQINRASSNDLLSANIGYLRNVPAGTFQRDADPANLSVVSSFHMSQHEITRAQWTVVTGWEDPSDPFTSSGTNDPVQNVHWYHAMAFCNKLSLLEGLTPVYSISGVDFSTLTYAQIPAANDATWNAATANWAANGYRLPTMMEWLWAAMGADTANPGAVNTTGRAKAFAGSTGSNFIGDYAVFGYDTVEPGSTTQQRTNPVGSKLANELGLHDLSGNVWEWIWDWGGSPPAGTLTDYRGAASGYFNRTLRGGSWYDDKWACMLNNAYAGIPSSPIYFGFRVVRN